MTQHNVRRPKGDFAYTLEGTIFIPEVKFSKVPDSCVAIPVRGYKYTEAVINAQGQCLGWILKEGV